MYNETPAGRYACILEVFPVQILMSIVLSCSLSSNTPRPTLSQPY
jgi:hypothetical protein